MMRFYQQRGARREKGRRGDGPNIATAARGMDMIRIVLLGLSLIALGLDAGRAQDIAGTEDCTKTSGLDKRTGCLQSNVNFLQRLVRSEERRVGKEVKSRW